MNSASQITSYFFGRIKEDEDFMEEYENHSDLDECGDCESDIEANNEIEEQPKEYTSKKIEIISNTNECSICLTEFEPLKFDETDCLITIQECHHKFCKECIQNYVEFKTSDIASIYHEVTLVTYENRYKIRVDETTMFGVPCPALKCKHIMDIKEFKPVASSTILERFERLLRVHTDNQERIKTELSKREQRKQEEERNKPKCRNCFGTVFIRTRKGGHACAACKKPSCPICYMKHPKSISCDKLPEFEERKAATERRRQMKKYKPIRFSEKIVECPKCTYRITRVEGCNFMTCICGQYLCYLCGCSLIKAMHFSHFVDGVCGRICKGPGDAAPMRIRNK